MPRHRSPHPLRRPIAADGAGAGAADAAARVGRRAPSAAPPAPSRLLLGLLPRPPRQQRSPADAGRAAAGEGDGAAAACSVRPRGRRRPDPAVRPRLLRKGQLPAKPLRRPQPPSQADANRGGAVGGVAAVAGPARQSRRRAPPPSLRAQRPRSPARRARATARRRLSNPSGRVCWDRSASHRPFK